MQTLNLFIFTLTLNSLLILALPASAEDKPIQLPAEDFYRMPQLTNVKLSPDGTHIIALKNIEDKTTIMSIDLATEKVFYPAQTDNIQYKFSWIDWGNNDRIMIGLWFDSRRTGADVSYVKTRLLVMDAKKPSKMFPLGLPNDTAVTNAAYVPQFQDNVIGRVPSEPDNVLLSMDREIPGNQTVYKANVTNGHLIQIRKADVTIKNWYADTQGIVRAGEGYNDRDRKIIIKVLDPNTNKWVVAWSYILFDQPEITPLGFGKNPAEFYLLANHQGRQALFKADLSKEGYPRELILSDPDYDISGKLIISPVTLDVVGIYYSDSANKSIFFDREFKAFQSGINKALPNSRNYITSISNDARKYILFSQNDITPGTYYFGNRDTKELTPIGDLYPTLTENVLVKKELLTYKARDGLDLEGYLSRPKNTHNKAIATIIYPHGGPMAEDGAEFDDFAAFFTNRGYAVFQPNFRGSSGRGFAFEMKAVGAYGLAMQDDLEDAAKFLIDQKITDPKKLGIVGASYGDYAALMGATKTPDLFQCAISFAGISDMKIFLDTAVRNYADPNVFRKQFGTDSEQLKKTSPARMVDKIKIPILLIHGSDDTSVPVDQSRIMASELKSQHKTYEYIELEGGSHYLDYLPHRKQTFEAMETFLKKYLPVE